MKALTKISIGFLSLAAVALWFTSCSSEDVASGTNQGNQESILLLSFNAGQMATRAVDNTLTADEKNIEDLTIGIFSQDGTRYRTIKTLQKTETESEATLGSGKFYYNPTTGEATAKIVTTAALTENDQVLVAANAGTTGAASLKDAKTAADFNKVSVAVNNGDLLTAAKLPKYGVSKLVKNGDNASEFKAEGIKVKNLPSKISLSSIEVAFTAGGPYAEATFKPETMFLMSVPNKLEFSDKAWVTPEKYLTGYSEDAEKSTFLSHTLTVLAGGDNTLSLAGTKKYEGTDKEILYTMPNDKTDANKTILVIAGKFSGEDKTVYYKMPLNVKGYNADGTSQGAVAEGTEAFQIPAGKHIKCSVTIKTIGTTDINAATGPLTATLKITVEDWSGLEQNTTFQ